ncbi:conserved domain protein [Paenibacillus sp. HGF5]|nr:conserved domain protein [Paenibacillus sp. HGF5]
MCSAPPRLWFPSTDSIEVNSAQEYKEVALFLSNDQQNSEISIIGWSIEYLAAREAASYVRRHQHDQYYIYME